MSDVDESLDDFCGSVRLFPLPNVVLFPHVIQPLHIFEPRYREMIADALASDRLIAMSLLKPDWEDDYHKSPPIYPVICIGRVFKEDTLSDGRYNLLLHGLSRARIVEEIETDKLYRQARVELLHDINVPSILLQKQRLTELGECTRAWFASRKLPLGQLETLLERDLSLGVLSDIFSFALPMEIEEKQRLLEETDVSIRVQTLLSYLQSHTTAPMSRTFPPMFSEN